MRGIGQIVINRKQIAFFGVTVHIVLRGCFTVRLINHAARRKPGKTYAALANRRVSAADKRHHCRRRIQIIAPLAAFVTAGNDIRVVIVRHRECHGIEFEVVDYDQFFTLDRRAGIECVVFINIPAFRLAVCTKHERCRILAVFIAICNRSQACVHFIQNCHRICIVSLDYIRIKIFIMRRNREITKRIRTRNIRILVSVIPNLARRAVGVIYFIINKTRDARDIQTVIVIRNLSVETPSFAVNQNTGCAPEIGTAAAA